ncbi:thiamine biosynthesis protein ThiS [Blastomonas marina]|jgi:thiazole synthase|uniref:Thiamine biosynthesis protein ThiS n=1 Tax=Blastomonas marina TaxID=1867408 RepID=A0ABQ1FHR0_9SPHN|nr:sulfur carrier protein ThiS [Blastomonas marina]GGA12738.1 thiamine biosynthesis protein ThiS [Blastomonas marina]
MADQLNITVNGESKRVAPGSVLDLLHALELDPKRVAVERNRVIAPRSAHADTPLAEGDQIEIVHFVGGG